MIDKSFRSLNFSGQMQLVLPCYLVVSSGYLVVTSGYLVVTSGYLIVTTGYLWLVLATSCCFWFLVLVTTGKWDVMHTNAEYLSCSEVEALRYFQLSDMRYDDRNVVTERVSTTVLQIYLIWTPAQILEHIIEFHRRI